MALSVFGKVLTQRPAPSKPKVGPPTTGKQINKVPTLVRPSVARQPVAQTFSRIFSPRAEQGASATPDHLQSRAINNVNAVVRMPNRGAANVLQGVTLQMADGTAGGSPITPVPIRASMAQIFKQVIAQGGNTNLRQTQIGTLAREAYLQRVRDREVTASIGVMKRRGFLQRQGFSYVAKPIPSTMGALEKAQLWRIKTGTPTGIVGDRATNYPISHIGSVASKTLAPLETNMLHTDAKIGGTGTAAAPTPHPVATIAQPGMSQVEAVGKAYAWASPDADAGTTPSSGGTLAQTGERWALLIGVGVLAFFLIRRS